MKKILLSLAAMALCLPALAETVTYECKTLGETTIAIESITVGDVTFSFEKNGGQTAPSYNKAGDIRLYAKNLITVKAADGVNVTDVKFTLADVSQYATITASVGTISAQALGDTELTWTGNANTFTLTVGEKADFGKDTNKAGQFRFSAVEVTYTKDGDNPGGGGDEPDQPDQPGDLVETTVYSGLALGANPSEGWTIEDATLPEGLSYVWSWDPKYGYKASAYVDGKNYEVSSYLISPAISLEGVTDAKLAFQQAVNYLKSNSELLSVWVREGENAWQSIDVTGWPTTDSWNFVGATADLSAYDGKTIQLGFLYKSTDTVGATWEIKDIKVTGLKESTGGEEPTPSGDEVTINWSEQGYENAQVLTTVEKGDVTLTFDKGSNSNSPTYYNTGTAIRLYGGNTMTFSVPEGTALAKIVFTTGSGNPFNAESTASNGTFTISENTWVATSNNVGSVTFTQGGTSGHVRIETTTIYLQEAGDDDRVGGDSGSEEPAPVVKMTVKEALDAIANDQIPAGKVQVEGIISEITEYSVSYGNATYLIVDAKGDANALTVYRCKWLDNASFTEEGLIEEGGTVVVEGTLKDYNGTPELTGCYVVSYTAPQGGGDEPGPDQPGEPTEPGEGVTENFNTGIGLPDGSANVPKEAAEYTSTETGITYTIMGCYANSGYIMVNAKNYANAYISWTLDFPMVQLVMTTTSGCSANANNYAEIYAGDTLIESVFVGVQNETITVTIPNECQAAGTVYKVMAAGKEGGNAGANEQFASFTYVSDTTNGVAEVEAAEGEAVYYNLQGVRVANPERGIFIKVTGNKAQKVVL